MNGAPLSISTTPATAQLQTSANTAVTATHFIAEHSVVVRRHRQVVRILNHLYAEVKDVQLTTLDTAPALTKQTDMLMAELFNIASEFAPESADWVSTIQKSLKHLARIAQRSESLAHYLGLDKEQVQQSQMMIRLCLQAMQKRLAV